MSVIFRKIKNGRRKLTNFRRKKIWRVTNNYAGKSTPVFICGVQRSGTTMLGACLERCPEVWHYPEHDDHAFEYYILRSNETISKLINENPYRVLVFKPLTDSHRVVDLMTRFGEGKAIWMFRRYEDRANSAVVKFGKHNLEILTDFSQDRNLDVWQAQGLNDDDIKLIKSFDYSQVNPGEAATIFWYLRNKLFFNQMLDKNNRVMPVSYESLVSTPAETMKGICQHLEIPFRDYIVSDIHARSLGKQQAPNIRPEIIEMCDEMYDRLDELRVRWNSQSEPV